MTHSELPDVEESGPLPTGLAAGPMHWVDGGAISRWTPVHSRHAKPIASRGQRAGFVVTKSVDPPTDPVVVRWLEHQQQLVTPAPPDSGDLFFWRLAVRLRSFAIDVQPRADFDTTLERIRLLTRRVEHLHVVFGFRSGNPIPSWVVRDGDDLVLAGMPDYHLVPACDETESVAAILTVARLKPRVHDLLDGQHSYEPLVAARPRMLRA